MPFGSSWETTPAPEPCIILVGKSFVLGQISAWVMTVGGHTDALLKSPFSSWDLSWLAAPCWTPLGPVWGSESPCVPWAAPNPRLSAQRTRNWPFLPSAGHLWWASFFRHSWRLWPGWDFPRIPFSLWLFLPFLSFPGVRPASLSEDSPAPCLPQAFPSINFLQIEIHLCVHLSEDANGLVTLTPLDTGTANNLPWALVSSSVKMETETIRDSVKIEWYIYLYVCVCIYIYTF